MPFIPLKEYANTLFNRFALYEKCCRKLHNNIGFTVLVVFFHIITRAKIIPKIMQTITWTQRQILKY